MEMKLMYGMVFRVKAGVVENQTTAAYYVHTEILCRHT